MFSEDYFEKRFDISREDLPYLCETDFIADLTALYDIFLSACTDGTGISACVFEKSDFTAPIPEYIPQPENIESSLLSETAYNGRDRLGKSARAMLDLCILHIRSRLDASEYVGFIPRLISISRKLALSDFQRFVFFAAAISALDAKYEPVYALLCNDSSRTYLTKGLVIWLFAVFSGEKPRGRGNLFSFSEKAERLLYVRGRNGSASEEKIRLCDRVLSYISGSDSVSSDLLGTAEFYSEKETNESVVRSERIESVADCLERARDDENAFILNLYGNEGSGRRFIIKKSADKAGIPLLFVDAEALCSMPGRTTDNFDLIALECLLSGAVPCFVDSRERATGFDGEGHERKDASNREFPILLKYIRDNFTVSVWISASKADFLSQTDATLLRMECEPLSIAERFKLIEYYSREVALGSDVDLKLIANQYILSPMAIRGVFRTVSTLGVPTDREAIRNSIRQHSANQLGRHATLINSVFGWDDLVADDEQKRRMKMICDQVRYRSVVGEEWGFNKKSPYGRGLCALFYGSPGTGKTMAVQVMANELGLDLYRIDISQLVSKYIGETQKNISDLFEKARSINALLFFDEADSLFSKRSEVKDSNDRYANADTAHLLQKLEDYDGITILATNYVNNIDDAFKRRIKFMVNFVFPTAEVRLKLWKTILPETARLDEEIDFAFFAERFELSGSNIKEILTNAAYIAASEKCGLANRHIIEAVKINFAKYGKVLTNEDFGYLGSFLSEGNRKK